MRPTVRTPLATAAAGEYGSTRKKTRGEEAGEYGSTRKKTRGEEQ
jgi:hypothetical protein